VRRSVRSGQGEVCVRARFVRGGLYGTGRFVRGGLYGTGRFVRGGTDRTNACTPQASMLFLQEQRLLCPGRPPAARSACARLCACPDLPVAPSCAFPPSSCCQESADFLIYLSRLVFHRGAWRRAARSHLARPRSRRRWAPPYCSQPPPPPLQPPLSTNRTRNPPLLSTNRTQNSTLLSTKRTQTSSPPSPSVLPSACRHR